MIALVDGDIIAYTVAAGCEDYDEKTALSKCSEYLEDLVFIHADCSDAEGFLTGYENFRISIAKTKPYKGRLRRYSKAVRPKTNFMRLY
jgi:hypothetical protein